MSLVFPNVEIKGNVTGFRNYVTAATTVDLNSVGLGSWVYLNPTLTAGAVGVLTVDGYTAADGDIILVKNQTTGVQNGIYEVSGSASTVVLTRTFYFFTGIHANSYQAWIQSGSVNAFTAWISSAAFGSDIVGTNNPLFVQYDVTKTLSLARGGTSQTSYNTNGVVYYDGTNLTTDTHLKYQSSSFGVDTTDTASARVYSKGQYGNMFCQSYNSINTTDIIAGNDLFAGPNIGVNGSILNPIGILPQANDSYLIAYDGNMFIGSNISDTIIVSELYSGTDTEIMRMTVNGNITIGDGSIATSATDGFLYLTSMAGIPTGVPTSYTGRVPLVIDTNNNSLYYYSGGAWRQNSGLSNGYSISPGQAVASNTTATTIAFFSFQYSLYQTTYGITILESVFWADASASSSNDLVVDCYDGTSIIGTVTIIGGTAAGIQTMNITIPVSNKQLQFRIHKTTTSGASPSIYGLQLEMMS